MLVDRLALNGTFEFNATGVGANQVLDICTALPSCQLNDLGNVTGVPNTGDVLTFVAPGVWSPVAPAATGGGGAVSSLVSAGTAASGARMLTHNSNDAPNVAVPFVEGFSSVLVNPACNAVGIGGDKVIQSMSIVGGQLQIGAAERTRNYTQIVAAPILSHALVAANATAATTLTVNNPQGCRPIVGGIYFITRHWIINHSPGGGGATVVGSQFSVNGGAFGFFSAFVMDGEATNDQQNSGAGAGIYIHPANIPAGTTQNFSMRSFLVQPSNAVQVTWVGGWIVAILTTEG